MKFSRESEAEAQLLLAVQLGALGVLFSALVRRRSSSIGQATLYVSQTSKRTQRRKFTCEIWPWIKSLAPIRRAQEPCWRLASVMLHDLPRSCSLPLQYVHDSLQRLAYDSHSLMKLPSIFAFEAVKLEDQRVSRL